MRCAGTRDDGGRGWTRPRHTLRDVVLYHPSSVQEPVQSHPMSMYELVDSCLSNVGETTSHWRSKALNTPYSNELSIGHREIKDIGICALP